MHHVIIRQAVPTKGDMLEGWRTDRLCQHTVNVMLQRIVETESKHFSVQPHGRTDVSPQ